MFWAFLLSVTGQAIIEHGNPRNFVGIFVGIENILLENTNNAY